MRTGSVWGLLFVALFASCDNAGNTSGALSPTNPLAPFGQLGPLTASLSGAVYDPETFFYALATFPPGPPDQAPPPALFAGIPFLLESAIPGATVSMTNGTATVPIQTAPTNPIGEWTGTGLPVGPQTAYFMQVTPPTGQVTLGGGFPFPPFGPFPATTYFPTLTVRPVIPVTTYCMNQVAIDIGDQGGLDTIAKTLGGTHKAGDFINPAKSGGVLLAWVFSFIPFAAPELFTAPANGITATTDVGTLYSIDWAPPGVAGPTQSALGYLAGGSTSIGYFAVVLPPKTSPTSVNISFTDTVTDPLQGRPWFIPPVSVAVQPSIITFARVFSLPNGAPPDPTANPPIAYEIPWVCNGTYFP